MGIDWASMLGPEVIYGSYSSSPTVIDPLESMHNMLASVSAMDDQVNRMAHSAAMDAAGTIAPDPEMLAMEAAEREYRRDVVSEISRYRV